MMVKHSDDDELPHHEPYVGRAQIIQWASQLIDGDQTLHQIAGKLLLQPESHARHDATILAAVLVDMRHGHLSEYWPEDGYYMPTSERTELYIESWDKEFQSIMEQLEKELGPLSSRHW